MWGKPTALLMVHVTSDGRIFAIAIVAVYNFGLFQHPNKLLLLLFSMNFHVSSPCGHYLPTEVAFHRPPDDWI